MINIKIRDIDARHAYTKTPFLRKDWFHPCGVCADPILIPNVTHTRAWGLDNKAYQDRIIGYRKLYENSVRDTLVETKIIVLVQRHCVRHDRDASPKWRTPPKRSSRGV
ncbi:hypothetical protein K0M31_011418 [Melipona bicolor]|uniref:Uncharacterized protein n=1 Tax=Melipona bicolor TaxID=60889 RepID=A0AA40GAQ7_9HYME|nr:hypothetical protein K0M31_011418 [Melipona bicolor]